MNSNSNFSGVRLSVARQWRGLTQEQLALSIGLTKDAISKLENGKNEKPEVGNLASLRFALQFPTAWFFAPDLEIFSPEQLTFRARRKMGKSIKDQATSATDIAVNIVSPAIRKRFRLPLFDLPDLSGFTPEEAADQLRDLWKLGWGPIPSVVRLLETKGIEVFNYYCECDDMDAWSASRDSRAFVFLNTYKIAGEREQFDAAHELGHLVLHRSVDRIVNSDEPAGKKIEDEANRFASAFLLPAQTFWQDAPRNHNLEAALVVKRKWRVSVAATFVRSHQLKILSDGHYNRAFKAINCQGWRRSEPNQIPRSAPKVHELTFSKLLEKNVGPHMFSQSLLMRLEDLSVLMPSATKFMQEHNKHNLAVVHNIGVDNSNSSDTPRILTTENKQLRLI